MKQRLGPIMADWIERAECGEKEKASRRSRFKRHVEPRLGHVQLARIAPATVEAFVRGLVGISSTTARKIFEDLRMFLDYSLRMGYISANPCDSVDKPRRRRYRSPIAQWTRDDVSKFFAACEGFGDKGLLFLTTYFTAGRQGEILGLPWEQVDFGEHTVTFVQDLERRQGEGAAFDDAKTSRAGLDTRRRPSLWTATPGPRWTGWSRPLR